MKIIHAVLLCVGQLTVKLVATSPHGNRCKQLKAIPTEVDYCAFVGDSITITCTQHYYNDIQWSVFK